MITKAWKYLCCSRCGSFYVEWDEENKWHKCRVCNLINKRYMERRNTEDSRKGEKRVVERRSGK